MRFAILIAAAVAAASPSVAAETPIVTGSPEVNAGAAPMRDDSVFRAFGGREGMERVVARLVVLYKTDRRLKPIFAAADDARLSRLLVEQFCYIAGGPCTYSGADMKTAHADMGLQAADFNALVENLQIAMDGENVPFSAQNKLLAKLAPMKRVVVTR